LQDLQSLNSVFDAIVSHSNRAINTQYVHRMDDGLPFTKSTRHFSLLHTSVT
jgi:hypothetical protein